jgi:Phage Mu protein F like protein
MTMADVGRKFTPPPEILRYFRDKDLRPAFSWLDVWGEEHAYAFTVAKVQEWKVLAEFKAGIDQALVKGETFETFREAMKKRLTPLGWWGPRLVADPDGKDPAKLVDFSRPARLQITFQSNMRAARAAGQWQRAQRTKAVLPYLIYVRSVAERKRPEHLVWAGTILPIDDPFWNTHFPPNGWNCKCAVRQIGDRERTEKLDAPGSQSTDEAPKVVERSFKNRRTGEIVRVPEGIDPGWQGNPGKNRAGTLLTQFNDGLAAQSPAEARRTLQQVWSNPFAEAAVKMSGKAFLPAGVSRRLMSELGAQSPVVAIANDDAARRIAKHGLSIVDFARLPDMIETSPILPDPRGNEQVRALFMQDEKRWFRAFVTISRAGLLRVTSFHEKPRSQIEAAFKRAGIAWPFGE